MENPQQVISDEERENCGCVFNWDDKFWESCEEHAREEAEIEREREAWT